MRAPRARAPHARGRVRGFGIAALFICEGLRANGPDGRDVAVDPYQFTALPEHATSFAGAGLDVLADAGVRDLVEFHAEESQLALPRLLAEERRFHLAFVDGNHRFEGVFLDLVDAGRLLGGRRRLRRRRAARRRREGDPLLRLQPRWAVVDAGAEGDAHAWTVLRTGSRDAFRRPYADFVEF